MKEEKIFRWAMLFLATVLTGCLVGCHRHTLQYYEGIIPTCQSEGQLAYYECADCGLRFSDAEGRKELDTVNLAIGDHAFEATEKLSDEEHREVCTVCETAREVGHRILPIEGRNVGHFYDGECACGHRSVVLSLPTIHVTTADGDAIGIIGGVEEGKEYNSEHEYEAVTITVDSHGAGLDLADAEADMKIRGNYSTTYSDKKPYRIRFKSKQSLLAMNEGLEAKSWVLLAEYKDRSLMRNATAFFLGDALLGEDGYYCSDFRFVELYVNGEYRGVYLLCEQQQVGKGRIDVPEPEKDSDAVNIGYFLELDYYSKEEAPLEQITVTYPGEPIGWNGEPVPTGYFITGYTVKSDVYSPKQNAFAQKVLRNILTIVDDALYRGVYTTLNRDGDIVAGDFPSARACVEAVIDVPSLVDTFLLNELCMDMDVGYSSFFMSIDMSDNGARRLVFEAPWDWDSSLGFAIEAQNFIMSAGVFPADGQTGSPTPRSYVNPWMVLLAKEPWYREAVSERWTALRQSGAIEEACVRMEVFRTAYSRYAADNAERWPGWLAFKEGSSTKGYVAATTNDASIQYLKNFLKQRAVYLDRLLAGST